MCATGVSDEMYGYTYNHYGGYRVTPEQQTKIRKPRARSTDVNRQQEGVRRYGRTRTSENRCGVEND